jgi:adenylate kinase
MQNIILLGKPGSGKGTIAKKLEEHGYHVLSGSDILRENSQSPDAKYYAEARHALDTGVLISSELINLMVNEKIKEIGLSQPFVFDGYPRAIEQAEYLFTLFNKTELVAFYIEIDNETVKERVLNRLTCRDCQASFNKVTKQPSKSGVCDHCEGELYQRIDDSEETLVRRLKQHLSNTQPVISVLKENIKFISIQHDNPELMDIIIRNS